MPYTLPTAEQFLEKFPEFAEVDGDKITAELTLANRQVDETWLEEDYQEAIMQLAAHRVSAGLIAAEGVGEDTLRSLSIGPISLSYGDTVKLSDLTTSAYGQAFLVLRKQNVPAIAIV